MLVAAIGGELGNLRIVGARHADDLGVGAAAANLHPVVFKQLDGDVAIGQQLDVVVELARGDGAGAGLFDLDCGAGADGLVEIGGRDVQPVAIGLDEKVGENRNGGLALDHALRGSEFLDQILAAYGNLHRCPLRGRLLHFGFNDRHRPTLCSRSRSSCLASLYNTLRLGGNGCLFFVLIVFSFRLLRVENRGSTLNFEVGLRQRLRLRRLEMGVRRAARYSCAGNGERDGWCMKR